MLKKKFVTLLLFVTFFFHKIYHTDNNQKYTKKTEQCESSHTKSGRVHKTLDYLKRKYYLNREDNLQFDTQHRNYVFDHKLLDKHNKLINKISSTSEPTFFKESITNKNWIIAMNKKNESLK